MKRKLSLNITEKMILSAFRTSVIFVLANMGASFIDGLVTSHFLGSAEMAAVGLASPFFSITSALCTCVGTGLVALCSHNFGSGNKDTMNKYFNSAFWAMLVASVVLLVVFFFGAEPIAMIFGARGTDIALLKDTGEYIRGLALGIPTFLISGVVSQVIQMDGGGKLVKISAVCCLITDAVFDVLAVLLGWGLFGIGLATSISTLVKFCILFYHFYFKKHGNIRLKLIKPKITFILEMVKSGSDTLILSVINIIKPIFLNAMIISFGGSEALSVLSVYTNLNGVCSVICLGLTSALSITVGMLYGEVNKRDIKRTAGFVQKLVLIMYAPIILLLLIFSRQIAQFYLPDLPQMWGMTVFALYCLSFCLISYSMIFLRIRYLQIIDRIKRAWGLTVVANFVTVVLCGIAASLLFATYGILATNAISSVVCILIIILVTQIRNKKFFVNCEDYLCLPEKFYSKREEYIDILLKQTESLNIAVSEIQNFCDKNEGHSKSISALPICTEKILNHLSYTTENNNSTRPNLYIRAEINDNDCRLIVRDNGCEYAVNEGELADAIISVAPKKFTVNLHRVLEFNSLILKIEV